MKKKLLLLGSLIGICLHAQQGKVGINTDTPTATLDIVSKTNTSATKALKISNSSSTEMVTVRDNGQVGINQAAPATDALLELNSASKALLLTRVTNVTDVATPLNGMMVYDITQKCIRGYENNAWSGCLSAGDGGGSSSTYPPSGSVLCNNEAFVNPKSMGTNFARGAANNTIIEDRPIILDTTGTRFFTNSNNMIYDLDVHSLYAANGFTNIYSSSIETRFPTSYANNPKGVWKEIKAIKQLFPTKVWKQFSNYEFGSSAPNNWLLLLSTDGELKTVRYQQRGTTSVLYPGVSGPEGIGKSTTAVTVNMAPASFYVTTDIKAYSAVGTQTATNWAWFEPYSYPYLLTKMVSGAIAYNQADGLYYSWGSDGYTMSSQSVPALSGSLLRSDPANINQAMTPLPATVLNNLVATLNTKVKEPSNKHCTILVQKGGPFYNSNTHPFLDFITTDNKVVRYLINSGFYVVLTLPAGVNPISLVSQYYAVGPSYTNDGLYILGSDGKIYLTSTFPTAVGQTGNVNTYANAIWGSTNFPFVTQIAFSTDNNMVFLANGKTGNLQSQISPPTYTYPLQWQSGTIGEILFARASDATTSMGSNVSLIFTKTQDNIFRVYDALATTPYNANGYTINSLQNYFYYATNIDGVTNKFLSSTEFYPSKCVTY